MFGWFAKNRRPSLATVAHTLDRVFAAKAVAARRRRDADLSEEAMADLLHADPAVVYVLEYVSAVCEGFGHGGEDETMSVAATVLERALGLPKAEVLPAMVRARQAALDAAAAFDAAAGLRALPPARRAVLSAAWSGRETGRRFARDALQGREELTGDDLVAFTTAVFGDRPADD